MNLKPCRSLKDFRGRSLETHKNAVIKRSFQAGEVIGAKAGLWLHALILTGKVEVFFFLRCRRKKLEAEEVRPA